MVSNKYTKEDCIQALQKAYDELGHSPSQHEYKKLDISPSYQTIAKIFGRWNKAKEEVGMSENRPSHLKYQDGCPEILTYSDKEWKNLSKNMRFRRRNQSKVAKIKMDKGCHRCGYDDNPTAIDFHHTNPDEKFMDVGTMITQGYSTERIMEEVKKCIPLCANCHRVNESGDIYNV